MVSSRVVVILLNLKGTPRVFNTFITGSTSNSNDESIYLSMINLYPQHLSEPSLSSIPPPLQ